MVSSRFLKWKNTIKKSHFDYLFNFNKKNGSVAEYIVSATHWLSAKGFGGINEMNIFSLYGSLPDVPAASYIQIIIQMISRERKRCTELTSSPKRLMKLLVRYFFKNFFNTAGSPSIVLGNCNPNNAATKGYTCTFSKLPVFLPFFIPGPQA